MPAIHQLFNHLGMRLICLQNCNDSGVADPPTGAEYGAVQHWRGCPVSTHKHAQFIRDGEYSIFVVWTHTRGSGQRVWYILGRGLVGVAGF
jgi:hypothetical protein